MALTASEEALVRQLLDQQAAILSLAGNEATITSKLGATKVTLADLVAASGVADADLLLMRQGTTDKSVTPLLLKGYAQDGMATQKAVQAGDYNTSVAGGTADAITGDYTPNVLALENGLTLFVRASAANTTTTPTFAPDGLTAKTIVKGNNLALVAGDIAGAGHWLEMNFDSALDKWVLQNPAVTQASDTRAGTIELATNAEAQALVDTIRAITPSTLAQALKGANQSLAGTGYQKLPGGLIIQWGITNLGSNLAGVGGASVIGGVTFPIAFPAGPLSASVAGFVPNSTGGEAVENFLSVQGLSATTLTVAATRVTGSGSAPEILPVAWICVGY